MDTVLIRTCLECGHMLSIINVGPVAYSICWNCASRSFLGDDFFDLVDQDAHDFNDLDMVWDRREEMIKDFIETEYEENIEEVTVNEVQEFISFIRERLQWQSAFRK